jgi:hypothetical protein
VNRQAHTRTILPRTSQSQRGMGLPLALIVSELEPCISPSTPSPGDRPFAHPPAGGKRCVRAEVWFTHWPLCPCGPRPSDRTRFAAARRQRRLSRCPSGKCFHRAPFLPYFPCLPSVTRFGANPAPHHPSTQRARAGDPDSAAHRALLLPDSSPNQVRWVPTPEKAPSTLGAGHTRVASRKSVPRAIRANTNKEKHNGTL